MPPLSSANLPQPQVLQAGGIANPNDGKILYPAYQFFLNLVTFIGSLVSAVNAAVGVNRFTLAAQPPLGPADAGFLGFVTDYGHFVAWDGAVWSFAPGDVGNGFRRDFAIVPQEAGWHLMDGSPTDYLVVGGAALTSAAYVPPNLTGTPAYPKSAAAYTGAITPAAGPGAVGVVTGQTADESAHTHVVPDQNTADEAAHTHNYSGTTSAGTGILVTLDGNFDSTKPVEHTHTYAGTTTAGTAHHHDVPSQPTAAGSAHHHAAGTLAAAVTVDATAEPAHVGWLPYFRR
jgi:hypothetical protein